MQTRALLPVRYVLSIGPLVLISRKFDLTKSHPSLTEAVEKVYSPFDALHEQSTPTGELLRSYVRLWYPDYPEPHWTSNSRRKNRVAGGF